MFFFKYLSKLAANLVTASLCYIYLYFLLQETQALDVLCVENRGIGKSSCPKKKSLYSTKISASDVLAGKISAILACNLIRVS